MKSFRAIAAAAVLTATLATGAGIAPAQVTSSPSPSHTPGQMTSQMTAQMTGQMTSQMTAQMTGQMPSQMDALRDQMRSTMTPDQLAKCDAAMAAAGAPHTSIPTTTTTAG